jgi:hypothetical protein
LRRSQLDLNTALMGRVEPTTLCMALGPHYSLGSFDRSKSGER